MSWNPLILVQYYLPPIGNINKDFLRDVFADKKVLFKREEIVTVHVPHYPELKIDTLFSRYANDPEMSKHVPTTFPKGRQIDRTYFFNVLNTVHPDQVKEILNHAYTQRNAGIAEEEKMEKIAITEDWLEQLKAVPFKSSK